MNKKFRALIMCLCAFLSVHQTSGFLGGIAATIVAFGWSAAGLTANALWFSSPALAYLWLSSRQQMNRIEKDVKKIVKDVNDIRENDLPELRKKLEETISIECTRITDLITGENGVQSKLENLNTEIIGSKEALSKKIEEEIKKLKDKLPQLKDEIINNLKEEIKGKLDTKFKELEDSLNQKLNNLEKNQQIMQKEQQEQRVLVQEVKQEVSKFPKMLAEMDERAKKDWEKYNNTCQEGLDRVYKQLEDKQNQHKTFETLKTELKAQWKIAFEKNNETICTKISSQYALVLQNQLELSGKKFVSQEQYEKDKKLQEKKMESFSKALNIIKDQNQDLQEKVDTVIKQNQHLIEQNKVLFSQIRNLQDTANGNSQLSLVNLVATYGISQKPSLINIGLHQTSVNFPIVQSDEDSTIKDLDNNFSNGFLPTRAPILNLTQKLKNYNESTCNNSFKYNSDSNKFNQIKTLNVPLPSQLLRLTEK